MKTSSKYLFTVFLATFIAISSIAQINTQINTQVPIGKGPNAFVKAIS